MSLRFLLKKYPMVKIYRQLKNANIYMRNLFTSILLDIYYSGFTDRNKRIINFGRVNLPNKVYMIYFT